MADLTVPWRSTCFPVFPNWFRLTKSANDDTRIVFCACGIPCRNLSVIPEYLRDITHLYQLPDCLVAVALVIMLEALRLPLAMISRRYRSWAAVWYGTMPLSVVLICGQKCLLESGLTYGNPLRGNSR